MAGDGFLCDQATIRWDSGPVTKVTATRGRFQQTVTVQGKDVWDGKHAITAACDRLEVPEAFTVRTPKIIIDPGTAPVGRTVTVQGRYFSSLCRDYVVNFGGHRVVPNQTPTPEDSPPLGQTVSAQIAVPGWASTGSNLVELECDDGAGAPVQTEQVAFQVPDHQRGWPLWVVIAVAGVLAVLAAARSVLRRRRPPPEPGVPGDPHGADHPPAHLDIEVLVLDGAPRAGASAWSVPLRPPGQANGHVRIRGGRWSA
ncbi:MAG TPA: hypothetical protein VFE14_01675 [Micromonosporaceae bacterium]|nr:hypothetical protein [Micromonosporaceae bacterium]